MPSNQLQLAEYLRDEGIARVLSHTIDSWKVEFANTADRILDENGSVTADDVICRIGYPPNHSNAIGGAMRKFAVRRNLICTYEKSTRASRHAAVIARWWRANQIADRA